MWKRPDAVSTLNQLNELRYNNSMTDITKFTAAELARIEAYDADLLMLKGQASNLEEAKQMARATLCKRFGVKQMPKHKTPKDLIIELHTGLTTEEIEENNRIVKALVDNAK